MGLISRQALTHSNNATAQYENWGKKVIDKSQGN